MKTLKVLLSLFLVTVVLLSLIGCQKKSQDYNGAYLLGRYQAIRIEDDHYLIMVNGFGNYVRTDNPDRFLPKTIFPEEKKAREEAFRAVKYVWENCPEGNVCQSKIYELGYRNIDVISPDQIGEHGGCLQEVFFLQVTDYTIGYQCQDEETEKIRNACWEQISSNHGGDDILRIEVWKEEQTKLSGCIGASIHEAFEERRGKLFKKGRKEEQK